MNRNIFYYESEYQRTLLSARLVFRLVHENKRFSLSAEVCEDYLNSFNQSIRLPAAAEGSAFENIYVLAGREC